MGQNVRDKAVNNATSTSMIINPRVAHRDTAGRTDVGVWIAPPEPNVAVARTFPRIGARNPARHKNREPPTFIS